jgi:predicted small lipoprotein YifL
MTRLLALTLVFATAACGVDGPPVYAKASPTGVTLSGNAKVGVVVK